MTKRATRIHNLLASSAFVVFVALSGCAAASDGEVSAGDWVEPGWVAQFRQEMEEDSLAYIACFHEFGIDAYMGPGHTFQLPTMDYPLPPGVQAQLDRANTECWERLGQLRWRSVPIDADAYQRMLDSRDCLIAHGHEVPEAPSAEAWVEGDGHWNPHLEWFDARHLDPGSPRLTAAEWYDVNAMCPQPGPFIFGVSGLP